MVLSLPHGPSLDRQQTSRLCKQKVAKSSAKTHGQEEPAIEGHGHQHEEVAHPYLQYMQNRLYEVQPVAVLSQHSDHLATTLNPGTVASINTGCGEGRQSHTPPHPLGLWNCTLTQPSVALAPQGQLAGRAVVHEGQRLSSSHRTRPAPLSTT